MNKIENFIQENSPDGGFLQSEHWRKFQESYGRKTYSLSANIDQDEPIAFANIITHSLPVVGNYFYIPRGPVVQNPKSKFQNSKSQIPNNFQFPTCLAGRQISNFQSFLEDLVSLAKEKNVGWIRIEPNRKEELRLIKENLPANLTVRKSSIDVQPKEILMLEIVRSEEELLTQMKQKTRYNIKLSQKRGVSVKAISDFQPASPAGRFPISKQYVDDFIKLVNITAKRDKIKPHPENYYRKMFEVIPSEILKLYLAEYQGKIIAANLVLFFGRTATYLHGASDNIHREVMAPYLLQWQAILDAKKAGCERYDLGGVKTEKNPKSKIQNPNSWAGITRFKMGFAPKVEPICFPGCYDIILKPVKYNLYRGLQKLKRLF